MINSTPAKFISLIRTLSSSPTSSSSVARLIPPLLRALRNLLVSTADLAWGHMCGVGVERKVVGTGLVGGELLHEEVKGIGVSRGQVWRFEANRALGLVFEVGLTQGYR